MRSLTAVLPKSSSSLSVRPSVLPHFPESFGSLFTRKERRREKRSLFLHSQPIVFRASPLCWLSQCDSRSGNLFLQTHFLSLFLSQLPLPFSQLPLSCRVNTDTNEEEEKVEEEEGNFPPDSFQSFSSLGWIYLLPLSSSLLPISLSSSRPPPASNLFFFFFLPSLNPPWQ